MHVQYAIPGHPLIGSGNMSAIPNIGHTITITHGTVKGHFTVADVIWHITNDQEPWVQIILELGG